MAQLRQPLKRIAVVGAGMTGITCATSLHHAGYRVTMFEKSARIGGRLATRRQGDAIAFDHGAPYLTAVSPGFRRLLDDAIANGGADYWPAQVKDRAPTFSEGWVVGTPGMNALLAHAAQGLNIRFDSEVTAITRLPNGWQINTERRPLGEIFDIVICTAPAPQTLRLLSSESAVVHALQKVRMTPCWALMVIFDRHVQCPYDVWQSDAHPLAWMARNNSKPQRNSANECWVVHANAEWSRTHLELPRERVAELMTDLLPGAFGRRLPNVLRATAHRWRYARTTAPLGESYLCNQELTLFAGGDWCLGAGAEQAYDSAIAIVQALASRQAVQPDR